ncbi:MoxR family ATPase [Hazenella sp. IB182357]|uniref:MoxR family ATPase n=2 Tax=Polycladospora coralii TaxID=2771432 RepID=A0A926NBH7_9BACL|nr:MoxR family ATPase [Polycladospora coralii]MBD1372275.1 MoxR family ATPase [Polycladospora coralii]MBS7531535.1 MoxR family ATPase [Polycladospora coralii]
MNMKQDRNLDEQHPQIKALIANVEQVLIGKRMSIEMCIVAILAKGHVLLEDVPGVGKTILVKALAKSLACEYSRIQFTPDMLASDVTGVSIYNQKTFDFEFRPGPLRANIILADEINRTSPKTQSALLEAMEEQTITVDGNTYPLSPPFFVMATQNPLEFEGTFPLPEAQLDRFLLKLSLGYPDPVAEVEMLKRMQLQHPITEVEAVWNKADVLQMQTEAAQVHVAPTVMEYMVKIANQTRQSPHLTVGASPRAIIALYRVVQAWAFMHTRSYVLPDDIKRMAPYVLPHRMVLHSEASFKGITIEQVLQEVLDATPIPKEI